MGLFFAALALSVVSSAALARLVGMAGNRFDPPEGLFGILTALAANSPEIAAAVTALRAFRGGVRRSDGYVIIAAYLAFVVVLVAR